MGQQSKDGPKDSKEGDAPPPSYLELGLSQGRGTEQARHFILEEDRPRVGQRNTAQREDQKGS